MLTCLRVRSFAIIEELEVELGPGLNVVTGETGAGKSILVRALELVLGGRARGDLVRAGADQAVVEALFEGPGIRARLEALGVEPDEQIVVRRTVLPSGRSRASINGRLATNAQLARLASGLVDISSQHEHHSLVDPASHLAYLDAFAALDARRAEVGARVGEAVDALGVLRQLQQRLAARAEREDLLRYQLAEIDKLDPKAGEEDALTQEGARLRHAAGLARAALGAEHQLHGADDAVGVRIARVLADLQRVACHDARLEPLIAQIRGAATDLDDAAAELGRYGRGLESEPRRLAEIDDRLAALRRLTRRHGGTLDEALAFRERARGELDAMDALEAQVADALATFQRALERAGAEARALSSARHAAADELASAFADELAALGMGGASVRVDVAPLDAGDAAMQVPAASAEGSDAARLSPSGIDRVEFRIAPNPGSAPLPLGQVASGGELSRALLGLKRVLAGIGPKGLYVFDEVDTGVGGAVAEVIGRKIAHVARHHQVLCITHLPQIAAFADRHLRVGKRVVGGATHSHVERLDEQARLEELARMVGGVVITSTTRRAASEMVAAARVGP